MKFLYFLLALMQLNPTTAWLASNPTVWRRLKDNPQYNIIDEEIHAEETGLAAEYIKDCVEIEISFGNWLDGDVFDSVVLGKNWTLTEYEREDQKKLRREHIGTVTRIVTQHLDGLSLKKADPSLHFWKAFMLKAIEIVAITGVLQVILDKIFPDDDREKYIVENRERINEISIEMERMRKYKWTRTVAQRLERALTSTLREITQNGRFSQELLDSIQPTFVDLVGDWERSLLKKYYNTASAVVTAHPIGRTNKTIIIEACFPNAQQEYTMYELTPYGAFDGNTYQWPIIPRYAINKDGEMIPVWDLVNCKPMGPVRMCKRFDDKLQITSCSVHKEERMNGCPYLSEKAEQENYVHVTSTMTGYVVATRANEVISITDERGMAGRTPITANVVFITVPQDTIIQVGNTRLKPRYAEVDVDFKLEEIPYQNSSGRLPKPEQFDDYMEGWIMDGLIILLIIVIVVVLVYLICGHRIKWNRRVIHMAKQTEATSAMEMMKNENP